MAAVAVYNIPTEFLEFAQEARDAQASFADVKDWARTFARKFYHDVSTTPGFLPIYNTLLSISNQTPEQTVAHANFEDNFDEEFDKALTTIQKYDDMEKWVRAEANRIYHVFDRQTKWKVIYDAINDATIDMLGGGDGEHSGRFEEDASSSSNNRSNAAPVFADDDEPTEAEKKEGRNQLNRVLHREFNNWWDAFVAEADEDTKKRAPSAEDRFCLHAAKVLEKKTGIDREELKPVVGAWLQAKLEADDDAEEDNE